MSKHVITFAGAIALAAGGVANASIVTQWNFNSAVPDAAVGTGNLNASAGSGTASTVLGGFGTGTFVTGGGTDATASDNSAYTINNGFTSSTNSGTRGFQFLGSTAGYWNIGFTVDERSSGTAIRHAQLQFTTDGTNWTNLNVLDFASPTTTNGVFVNGFAATGITNAAGNNANFGIRMLSVFAPSTSVYQRVDGSAYINTSAAGTWRVDMATFTGTANSAPTALASSTAVTAGSGSYVVDLATLFGDVDVSFGDVVAASGGSGPAEFSRTGNILTFTAPASIGSPSEVFTYNYTASDSVGASASSTVTFTVTPTPGSAALMGMGLLASARRRRA